MSDAKRLTTWTPGPWEVYENTEDCGQEDGEIASRGVRQIGGAGLNKGVEYELFSAADAHLIAAAPALYAALGAMVEDAEEVDAHPTSDEHPLHAARTALAAARGEQG